MQMHTIELRCPYCHAPQSTVQSGDHTCEFCLRGFTAVDATRAHQHSAAQADAWLRARVGASVEAEVVDQVSRGYIFNQRLLPELRRDTARALEGLGPWLQEPLIMPELARGQARAPHPLVVHGDRMRALVELRGRLDHEVVRRFAVDELAQGQLGELGGPLDELIHLINTVEAAQRGGPGGWRAVRSNFEALAQRDASATPSGAFIELRRERWRLLASLAHHYDECASGQHPPSQLEAVETSIVALTELADRLRTCEGAVEARASALAVEREAAGARVLARWLRCRARLPGARARALPGLCQTLAPLIPQDDPERGVSLVEGWTELAAVARQETPIAVIQDFSWAEAWADSAQGRKRLGLFGEDEELVGIDRFYLPVWVVELSYSEHRGRLLGGGVEQRALALLDACACTADKLALFDPLPEELRSALAHPRCVDATAIALPETNAADAQVVVRRALAGKPALQNARFEIRGLALAPAVTARFRTRTGQRQASAALRALVPTSNRARERVETGRWFFSHFAR